MAGMDSMKRMADMCQQMMKGEKAVMPYIIGVSVLFGLLLFIALVLLIVLEIQWIKYWSRNFETRKHRMTAPRWSVKYAGREVRWIAAFDETRSERRFGFSRAIPVLQAESQSARRNYVADDRSSTRSLLRV